VSFLFSNAYISFIFSVLGFSVLTIPKHAKIFLSSIGFEAILCLFFLIVYSFAIDVVTGSLFFNFTNSFFVRGVSLVVVSAIPAYFLVSYCLRWNRQLALDVISIAFWIQSLFWVVTFLEPSLKVSINSFMGGGANAANLRIHNLDVRGFGVSNEINFTGPFVTVLVCFLFLRRPVIGFVSTVTQLINSNLVSVAILIGMTFSKVSLKYKLVFLASCSVLIYMVGDVYFPRLEAEFGESGSRTVNALMKDHFIIINDGFWAHAFGEAVYTFQGASKVTSDIGWVHFYSYGGIFYILLFLFFIFFLSFSAFGFSYLGFAWFCAAIVLNTKGLLFSPNAYFFITFIFIFLNYSSQRCSDDMPKRFKLK
jgi:hypothetical protein